MSDQATQSQTSSILLTAAGFVVIVAGMRAAESILVPLLVVAFLAIISLSPVF